MKPCVAIHNPHPTGFQVVWIGVIGHKNSTVVVHPGVMNPPKCTVLTGTNTVIQPFRWHALYVKDKAEEWRYTDRFLKAYSADGHVRSIDPVWRDEVLGDYLGAFGFSEYGLFNSHSSVVRDCLGDTIAYEYCDDRLG